MKRHIKDKFWKNIAMIPFHTCWEWTGAKTGAGYGAMRDGYKNLSAHMTSYKLHNGKIPKGKYICHTCDNPGCVNPIHLYAGTQSQNINDAVKRGRHRAYKGENHSGAKLTEKDIKNIRYLQFLGTLNQTQMAQSLGVTQSVIADIVHRRTWKHV